MAKRKAKIYIKDNYSNLIGDLSGILGSTRKASARSVNSILSADYWIIGWKITLQVDST